MQPPVRAVQAAVRDKLLHGLVFFGVWCLLAWVIGRWQRRVEHRRPIARQIKQEQLPLAQRALSRGYSPLTSLDIAPLVL